MMAHLEIETGTDGRIYSGNVNARLLYECSQCRRVLLATDEPLKQDVFINCRRCKKANTLNYKTPVRPIVDLPARDRPHGTT